MMVLVASGYGASEFRKYGLQRATVLVLAAMVWGLGWWSMDTLLPHMRINLGFLLLSLFAWAWLLVFGRMRWWLLAPMLGVLATVTRMLAPFAASQAQVLPVATIETVGLGVAAGISSAEPFPAAVAALAAEGLAALLTAARHQSLHDLGRHDLAALMLASLSAWVVGWVALSVVQRLTRAA